MNDSELRKATIISLASRIKARQLSPSELVESILDRIERVDGTIRSYITVTEQSALKEAKKAEKEIRDGKYRGPLHGIPLSVKDNMNTKGIKTTSGSRIFADYVPNTDATVVSRLRNAGAVIVGKVNLHELAGGVTCTNPYYGQIRNPWSLDRIPGGSSGGTAASVAASLCLGSLGSDSGGSIRVPAALCGVVGTKATYGRVSRYGVSPIDWSLEHIGPMTKTVSDNAIMLRAIAGHDPLDPSSSPERVPNYPSNLHTDLSSYRIGVIKEQSERDILEPDVYSAFRKAMKVLESSGAKIEEVSLPWMEPNRVMVLLIVYCEAVALLWDQVKNRMTDLSRDIRMWLEFGKLIPAEEYLKAQRMRRLMIKQAESVMRDYDVLVSPTVPSGAPKIIGEADEFKGKRGYGHIADVMEKIANLTSIFNITTQPAITVPCGFTSDGLPIGLQIGAAAFDEESMFKVAYEYERQTDWHERTPPV